MIGIKYMIIASVLLNVLISNILNIVCLYNVIHKCGYSYYNFSFVECSGSCGSENWNRPVIMNVVIGRECDYS